MSEFQNNYTHLHLDYLSRQMVYIYAISSFLIFRAFEQLKVNLILNNPNVKIIGMGTGFCYSQDGPTHHSLEDIGVLRPYSNSINIYTASNSISSELISKKVYNNKGIDYVRLDKGNYNYDNSYKNYKHLDNLFIFKKENSKMYHFKWNISELYFQKIY